MRARASERDIALTCRSDKCVGLIREPAAGSGQHAQRVTAEPRARRLSTDAGLRALDQLGSGAGGSANEFGDEVHDLGFPGGRCGFLGSDLPHCRVGGGRPGVIIFYSD